LAEINAIGPHCQPWQGGNRVKLKVPYIQKGKIADIATRVMISYQAKLGHLVKPPIPAEDIIERLLNVKLNYIDFEEKLGIDGVLGATYVHKRMICINENLLNDKSEGRLAFTCSHEIGHWVLHRKFIHSADNSGQEKKTIICRTENARLPIEWQADYFASCLLMPEEYVKDAYYRTFGPDPIVLYNVNSHYEGPLCFDPCTTNWHLIALAVNKSGKFSNVSKQAMIIRLQELGLVVNKTTARMDWQRYSSSGYNV
jgi:Zn-dependent peptidase ImmA (M78 family)